MFSNISHHNQTTVNSKVAHQSVGNSYLIIIYLRTSKINHKSSACVSDILTPQGFRLLYCVCRSEVSHSKRHNRFSLCVCLYMHSLSVICVFVLTPSAGTGSGAPAETKQVDKLRKLKSKLKIPEQSREEAPQVPLKLGAYCANSHSGVV